ncbi:Multidrug resistance-associated protein 5 [Branchiostoma belcheri]|nr:Multidrug resistance-associated protein 5 [Branchiostoma belcheri]
MARKKAAKENFFKFNSKQKAVKENSCVSGRRTSSYHEAVGFDYWDTGYEEVDMDYRDINKKSWKYKESAKTFIPIRSKPEQPSVNPLDDAGLLSFMTVTWLTPLIKMANKGKLTLDNVWQHSPLDTAKPNYKSHMVITSSHMVHPDGDVANPVLFERLWQEEVERVGMEKASLPRTIWRFTRTRMLMSLLTILIFSAGTFLLPAFLVRSLLRYTESPDTNWPLGIGLVIAIFVTEEANGIRVLGAILTLIFTKITRLRSLKDKTVGEKPHVDSSEQRLNSPAPTDHVAFWRANHSAQTGTRPPARPQRVESDAPPSQRHRLTICIFCRPAAARPASGITRLEGGQTPPGLVSLPWNPNSLSGPQKPFARWCKLPLRGSLARGEFGWPDNANSPQAQLLRSAYQACRSVARPGKLPDGRLNIRRTRRPEDTEAEYRRRIRQESTAAEVRQESTAVEERPLRPVVHDLIRKLSKRGVATRQVRQDDVLREIAGHVDGYESPRNPHAAVGDLILLEIQRRLFNTNVNNNDGEAS